MAGTKRNIQNQGTVRNSSIMDDAGMLRACVRNAGGSYRPAGLRPFESAGTNCSEAGYSVKIRARPPSRCLR